MATYRIYDAKMDAATGFLLEDAVPTDETAEWADWCKLQDTDEIHYGSDELGPDEEKRLLRCRFVE